MNKTILPAILLIGLLTACGSPAADAPSASQPTHEPAAPTQTSAPADTAAPANPTESVSPTEDPSTATVSFANDVLPILQNRCRNCHGGNDTEEGLALLTYDDVMKGSDNGFVVIPGNAANSLLVEVVLNQDMPKRGPKLTPAQVQIIADWVNQGALNN
jgi:mono/diheme cytochrome c family protein